jgi:FlaA1/EpsC-like NDP-sugar epimerase
LADKYLGSTPLNLRVPTTYPITSDNHPRSVGSLVAVVGATGAQGGSVVKALAESIKPYRVRGFSRDSTKLDAQKLVAQGVEVVDVSLVLGNVKNVFKVFEGTNIRGFQR